jgi:hypothetical protein
MLRKIIMLVFLLLLAALPVGAQESNWMVYLYNASQAQLIGIDSTGAQTEIDLGLPSNVYPSQAEYPFSADGSRAAFCVTENSADGTGSLASVRILNVAANTTETQIDLGAAIGCSVGRFNEDGTRIGVGIVYDFPFSENPNIAHLWEVLVIDVASGQIVSRLTPEAPMLQTIDGGERWAYLPIIQRFAAGQVTFALAPYGTDNIGDLAAFRWEPATDALVPVEGWGNWNSDYLTTGELVWTEHDPSLPAGQPGGPMPMYNVVRLSENEGEARTVFHSFDWLPYQARFVNNGQDLLVSLLAPFNEAAPDTSQGVRLMLVGRDGARAEVGSYASYVDTATVPNGFAVLWAENTAGTAPPQIYLDVHQGESVVRLWEITSDNMGVSWSIVWSSASPVDANLQPFPTENVAF